MLIKIPDIVSEIKQTINTISAVEAKKKCTDLSGVVIDVREPSEVSAKTATGTINIPRGLIEMKVSTLYPDENTAIFIHCASGARAVFSAEQLVRLGYKNVWAITCNIDDVCQAL